MQDMKINIDVSALTDQIEALAKMDGLSHGLAMVLAMHFHHADPTKATALAGQIGYGPVVPPELHADLAQQHLEEVRQALRGEYKTPDT